MFKTIGAALVLLMILPWIKQDFDDEPTARQGEAKN
jgi:hypothetical protein